MHFLLFHFLTLETKKSTFISFNFFFNISLMTLFQVINILIMLFVNLLYCIFMRTFDLL